MLPPDSKPKRFNALYHAARRVKKDREFFFSALLAVGAIRPRAFTERPYKIDLLSTGKPALWKAPLLKSFLLSVKKSAPWRRSTPHLLSAALADAHPNSVRKP